MIFSLAIFAYLGPETMLPMTSAVAGVVGVVMLLGRTSLRWVFLKARRMASMVLPRSKSRRVSRKIGDGPIGRIETPVRERA